MSLKYGSISTSLRASTRGRGLHGTAHLLPQRPKSLEIHFTRETFYTDLFFLTATVASRMNSFTEGRSPFAKAGEAGGRGGDGMGRGGTDKSPGEEYLAFECSLLIHKLSSIALSLFIITFQ